MSRRQLCIVAPCAAAITATIALPAFAQPNLGAHLTDGPAILDYTTNGAGAFPATSNGSAGDILMNFQVRGPWNTASERQVFSGNWFYRFQGDDRERHLINPGTRTPVGSNQMDWTFPTVFTGGASAAPVPNLSAEMGFQVFSTGANSAYFYTYLCFTNSGSTPIDVTTFFAADIDLGGTFGGDVYSPLVVSGAGRTWNLTEGAATGIMFGPGADAAGVGAFSSILGSLTNPSFTTFMGDLNAGGFGPGDLAAVMQFERTVHPGTPVCIPVYVGIGLDGELPIAPAPASISLISLTLLSLNRRRR